VFWGKVAEMGCEICPDLPIFSAKGEYSVGEEQNNQDIDFNLSSFSMGKGEAEQVVISPSAHASKSSEAQAEDIDFDLSSFSMENDEVEQDDVMSGTHASKSSDAQAEGIDFDLSSFSMDFKEVDELSNSPTQSDSALDKLKEINKVNADYEEKEFESFDFDFSSNGAETTSINDFDFSDIENIDQTAQDNDFSEEKSLDMSDDFDFNFEMPLSAGGLDPNKQVEFGVSDLTDMDELETKLDLAKAYIDMGDADAAKDLAREVLEQGTDEQKKSAQSLLDELG
jgi:pilus assembly protein FimV